MKLYIPACGDRLTLIKDWTFDLYLERRNLKFAYTQGLVTEPESRERGIWASGKRYHGGYKIARPMLPKGTVLECDRVYIRTFSKSALHTGNDFDSISWKVVKNDKPVRHQRFWVKLSDCYEIEYSFEVDSLYRDRVKAVRAVLES